MESDSRAARVPARNLVFVGVAVEIMVVNDLLMLAFNDDDDNKALPERLDIA